MKKPHCPEFITCVITPQMDGMVRFGGMRTTFYKTALFSFCFVVLSACINKPSAINITKQDSSDSIAQVDIDSAGQTSFEAISQPDEKTTDTVLTIVRNLAIIKKLEHDVDELSNHERHVSFRIHFTDSSKLNYEVIVGEDNGQNIVTYHNIILDAKTLKILSIDAE
jgi:hypothetical protein